MNLIGNCCISNFLLRLYGFGNTNPFTWVDVDFNSIYNLITNYDKINWNNFELIRNNHAWFKNTYVYEIVVDDKVKITYEHYLFDENYKTPYVNGANVRYCKIWEYIVQKYNEHKDFMIKLNKPPVFILEWEHLDYDELAFEKLISTNLKYKVVIITHNLKFKDVIKDNLLVIYDPHGRGCDLNGWMPKKFAEVYQDTIKEFILNEKI